MTILETNERLAETYRDARYFLSLDHAARADSEWFKSFLTYPGVRSFFKQSVFGKGTVLKVASVTQVAHAYVACFEREPSEPLPTAAEVRVLMKKAAALESELAAESSSWVPSELEKSFRNPIKNLRHAASTVDRRSAGRPAFCERRASSYCILLGRFTECAATFGAGLLPRSLLGYGKTRTTVPSGRY
jgi:hypothetical protein